MGDLPTLAKARMELEELYMGIPDDSVNLTFQYLADMKQKANASASASASASEKKKSSSGPLEAIQEAKTPKQMTKLPSLDFSRGLQGTKDHDQNHHLHHGHVYEDHDNFDSSDMEVGHRHHHDSHNMHMHAWDHGHHRYGSSDGDVQSHRSHTDSPIAHAEFRHGFDRSLGYGSVSVVSLASNCTERGQKRRPGIPHSNICAICTTYIYIFRHRCLVCGRVYCRQCVFMGMGEMTEGRKCIPCLGRRFSQRYIKKAGEIGWCWSYPSTVKQTELKWAEKGPRKRGERAYGHSAVMTSRTRSPTNPRSPTRIRAVNAPPSFVASSPIYSPYTPTHHHLPL